MLMVSYVGIDSDCICHKLMTAVIIKTIMRVLRLKSVIVMVNI